MALLVLLGGADFLVEENAFARGRECHGVVLAVGLSALVVGRERQIERGEGEHHFGETAGGFGEVGGTNGCTPSHSA